LTTRPAGKQIFRFVPILSMVTSRPRSTNENNHARSPADAGSALEMARIPNTVQPRSVWLAVRNGCNDQRDLSATGFLRRSRSVRRQ
jgi:hypothetical protein